MSNNFDDVANAIKKIGERIKTERKKQDLTLDDLADKIGVSRQTISKWEKGVATSGPSLWELVKMCQLFQCDLGYIVGEYECKTRPVTDIHNETGLHEDTILNLQEWAECKNSTKELVYNFLDDLLDWDRLEYLAIKYDAYKNSQRNGELHYVCDSDGNFVDFLPQDAHYLLFQNAMNEFISFARTRDSDNNASSKSQIRREWEKMSESEKHDLLLQANIEKKRGK